MRLDLRYLGRSAVRAAAWGVAVSLSPNLSRERVFFDAEVAKPVLFREAMSALHEVVVSDLRFKTRDHTAYLEWKKEEAGREAAIRREVFEKAKRAELAQRTPHPPPPNLAQDFKEMHALYWKARRSWANEIARQDPELFRHLVPCDPVITVAPDTVFFEAFSKDESSYGCLYVERDAFRGEAGSGMGTTNVDYSLGLYEHFQTLRSYRPARLLVDPTGFGVRVLGREDFREEKIDLPSSWLRGFGQLQAAMTLPSLTVPLSRDAVYSILAFLKRHREKTGPRCLRFKLRPGESPVVVLEPWGIGVTSGTVYRGEREEEIKVWGRRRLFTLSRLLPQAERFEVRLLGSGLPSFWTARLPGMSFVLGLSGWTANDWTSGANLDLLAGSFPASAAVTAKVAHYLEASHKASLPVLQRATGESQETVLGSLNRLAKLGQVIHDFSASCYRFRCVMPEALSEKALGPEPPEWTAGLALYREKGVKLGREEELPEKKRLMRGRAGNLDVEAILGPDGAFSRATCSCSHFRRFRLRAGPCRHLLALRLTYEHRGDSLVSRILN